MSPFQHRLICIIVSLFITVSFSQDERVSDNRKEELLKLFDTSSKIISYSDSNLDLIEVDLKMEEFAFVLSYFYEKAKRDNDFMTQDSIKFPLAVAYHNLTRFDEALPILQVLATETDKYTEDEIYLILKKLEEEYRAIGNYADAILIRERRIKLGHVKGFYDLYSDVGLNDLAIDDYKKLVVKPKNNVLYAMDYERTLGNLFFKASQFDSAKVHYNKGIQHLYPILNTNDYPGFDQYTEYTKNYFYHHLKGNIAASEIEQGEYGNVEPILKKDLEESRNIREVDNRIVKWLVLAKLYTKEKNFREAQDVLDSVKINMIGKRALPNELNYLKLKGTLFQNSNNTDSAFYYLKSYVHLKDSINIINKQNQSLLLLATLDNSTQKNIIREQRLEIENQLAAKSLKRWQVFLTIIVFVALLIIIGLLIKNYVFKKKTQQKIELQNEELIQKNEENELLLREVHHRVKNNLQTISSLLGLQSNTVEDELVKQAFLEGQNRVHSMALIHKRLYESDQLGVVDFQDYASQLCHNLLGSFGMHNKVEYDITSTVKLDIEQSVPLGLILNEILTNILKYGDSEDGIVKFKIKMVEEKKNLRLQLRDYGKGFDLEKARSKNTLGLRLIDLLSRQIDGVLSINSNSLGTAFNLVIPKPK